MASRMCIFFTLTCCTLFGFTTVLDAGGAEGLDKNTIIVFSVPDWQQSLSTSADSDVARFMAEPAVAETIERLTTGFTNLISNSFEADEDSKNTFNMVWEHAARMHGEMTGQFVFGVGYRMDPDMGMPMPNVVVDFHAPAEFGDTHRKMLDMLKQGMEAGGQMAIPASFAIGDVEFSGLEMMPGVGIYIGQFEDHHVIGTNKASLQGYLATGDTAVGERFGSTTIYKAAENTLRRGDTAFYFNMDAIWNLTPMMDMMAGGGLGGGEGALDPSPSKMISAIGLDGVNGIAGKSYYSADGSGADVIVAMKGRPGILGIIPAENGDITLPAVIPADSSSAFLMRMNFSKVFDIVTNIGSAIEGRDPEEMRAEVDAGLEEMKEMTGIDVKSIVASLEGSVFGFTPPADPDAPPPNPMAMMMGGGMGPSMMFNFGFKINDREPWEAAMGKLGGPEMMGPALKKEEFQGREVWSFDPLGDVPPEFAGDGPQFVPGWVFEDDWLMISMAKDDLLEMLRLADDEGGSHLGSSGGSARIISKVKSTQGMSISLQDTGKQLSQSADILRPLLGILPLMAPEIAGNEDFLFLFDPSNIPESELFSKYFGWTATRVSVVPEGLKMYSFTERVTDPAADQDKEKADTGAGL